MRYTDATSLGRALELSGVEQVVDAASRGSIPFFSIFSFARKGLTRAQRRKQARMRYRMFVDNIVMHHKRIHDRNREIAVANARAVALSGKSKTKELGAPKPSMSPKRESTKWRNQFQSRNNILETRNRIEARKMRAKSRWESISGGVKGSSREVMASLG